MVSEPRCKLGTSQLRGMSTNNSTLTFSNSDIKHQGVMASNRRLFISTVIKIGESPTDVG
jgi:hypothetical protein